MSLGGNHSYANPDSAVETDGPNTCLVCRDGRQGLLVDISAAVPSVGTYTKSVAATDFEIIEISFGIDTSKPVFFGQYINGAGHIERQCCDKIIGTALVRWTPDGEAEVTSLSYIYLSISEGLTTDSSVSLYFTFYNYSEYVYWFRFYRDSSGYPANSERPFCSIISTDWTAIGNTQAADYDAALFYLTENESLYFSIHPHYCNHDGTHTHPGVGNTRQNPDDTEPGTPCFGQCNACNQVEDYEISVSGLTGICISGGVPDDDTATLPISISCLLADLTYTATADTGASSGCGGTPAGTSTYEVNGLLEFLGDVWTSDKLLRLTVTVTIDTVGSAFGYAYFKFTCAGGIIADSQSVTLSGGAGSITVDIDPA